MPFDIVPADRAETLLNELLNLREKLVFELSRPEVSGNLDEQNCDRFLSKLAEVQTCITATREIMGG